MARTSTKAPAAASGKAKPSKDLAPRTGNTSLANIDSQLNSEIDNIKSQIGGASGNSTCVMGTGGGEKFICRLVSRDISRVARSYHGPESVRRRISRHASCAPGRFRVFSSACASAAHAGSALGCAAVSAAARARATSFRPSASRAFTCSSAADSSSWTTEVPGSSTTPPGRAGGRDGSGGASTGASGTSCSKRRLKASISETAGVSEAGAADGGGASGRSDAPRKNPIYAPAARASVPTATARTRRPAPWPAPAHPKRNATFSPSSTRSPAESAASRTSSPLTLMCANSSSARTNHRSTCGGGHP